jgi:hypothetical protein
VQASAKFRWRPKGATEYTEYGIEGAQNTYTVPTDTFATEQIEWQVVLTSDDGIEGTPSPWYTLTTVDAVSSPATESPKSALCDGSEPITFKWIHNITTGTAQGAYELQFSADGGTTWNELAAKTASPSVTYDVPADTLPAGTILWRVRTYNTDDVASEWSEAAKIVVRAAPPIPSISGVEVSPRPMVSWQSLGQQAYQVIAGGYDSGAVFGTAKSHKVPLYLADGETTVSIRVQNSFGLWSAWANVTITISNTGAGTLAVRSMVKQGSARLMWDGKQSLFYVYRDGEVIGKTTAMEYTDHLAIGKHRYTIRGVIGDNYTDAEITEIPTTGIWLMAVVGVWDWLPLRYRRDTKPQLTGSRDQIVSYQHFEGRVLPVAEISEFINEQYNFQFCFVTDEDARAAHAMLGKVVTIKTPYGQQVTGVLGVAPWMRDKLCMDVSFTVRAVDYKDVIMYDV